MSQISGFFDAELNEETQEYDLEYFSNQFASYFSLFVGNGVFGSPTNQLKVNVGDGLRVVVNPGWAFINGYWYNNDSELELVVLPNNGSTLRVDSIMVRWSNEDRNIRIIYVPNSTELLRDGSYYDLKIAEIIVPAAATQIMASNISDTRTNENLCGLVTSLLKVQTTEDLFAQYEAIFNQWFDSIKGQVSGDLGVQLKAQIGNLANLKTTNKDTLVNAINEVENDVEGMKDGTVTVAKATSAESAATAISAGTSNTANSATTAGTAAKLETPRKINGIEFDGSKDITIKDNSKPDVIYSTTEPTTVPTNTIVFVYEE